MVDGKIVIFFLNLLSPDPDFHETQRRTALSGTENLMLGWHSGVFPDGSVVSNPPANAGNARNTLPMTGTQAG